MFKIDFSFFFLSMFRFVMNISTSSSSSEREREREREREFSFFPLFLSLSSSSLFSFFKSCRSSPWSYCWKGSGSRTKLARLCSDVRDLRPSACRQVSSLPLSLSCWRRYIYARFQISPVYILGLFGRRNFVFYGSLLLPHLPWLCP